MAGYGLDVSDRVSASILAKLEAQRKLLLDLGGRNKLINFKHSGPTSRSEKQNYLRIVDEVPELIVEKLDQEERGFPPAESNERFSRSKPERPTPPEKPQR